MSKDLLVEELPDNKGDFLLGAKVKGVGKGNELYVAIFYADPDPKLGKLSYAALDKWLQKWAKKGPVLIFGDFNQTPSSNLNAMNKVIKLYGLTDIGKEFGSKPTTSQNTRIDCCLASSELLNRFTEFQVVGHGNREMSSYHRPCVTSLQWDPQQASHAINISSVTIRKGVKAPSNQILDHFKLSVNAALGRREWIWNPEEIDNMTSELVNVLKEASDLVFPKTTLKLNRVSRPLPALVEMAREKNTLRRLASAEAKQGNEDQARHLRKQAKSIGHQMSKTARATHKSAWHKIAEKVDGKDQLFRYLKSATLVSTALPAQMSDGKGTLVLGTDRIELLRHFYADPSLPSWDFDEDFKATVDAKVALLFDVPYESLPFKNDPLNQPFSLEEVKEQLKALVACKAAGPDEVHPYMLKWAPDEFAVTLTALFYQVWHTNTIPSAWKDSHVRPIHKSGKERDLASSYRPIFLISVLGKLLSRLIHKRLYKAIDTFLPEFQQGFREGRGCVEMVWILREVCELRYCRKEETFVAFLDVSNAFPTTWRSGMFHRLFEKLGNCRMLRLVHTMYQSERCRVVEGENKSEWWEPKYGVKTGDPLSPLLFLPFISALTEVLLELGLGVVLPNGTRCPLLLFADDVALLASNKKEMERMLLAVSDFARKWRFEFNNQKCGVLEYKARKSKSRRSPNHTWILSGQSIPHVAAYKYLGVIFQADGKWTEQVSSMLSRSKSSFGLYKHLGIKSNGFSFSASRKIALTCLAPALEWGSAVWSDHTKTTKLCSLWHDIWRKVAGVHPKTKAEVVMGESMVLPLGVRWHVQTIRLLADLVSMPATRLGSIVFNIRLADHLAKPRKHSWFSKAIGCLNSLSLEEYWDGSSFAILAREQKAVLKKKITDGARAEFQRLWSLATKADDLASADFVSTRAMIPELLYKGQGSGPANAKYPVEHAYMYTLPSQSRSLMLEIAADSLPLQVCRESILSMRHGGANANNICALCGDQPETLHHFLLDCATLMHLRPDDLRKFASVTAACQQLRHEVHYAGEQPLLSTLKIMWQHRRSVLKRQNAK